MVMLPVADSWWGAGVKLVGERKGLTMKERLRKCQQTERQRITFGKVSLTPCLPTSISITFTASRHLEADY